MSLITTGKNAPNMYSPFSEFNKEEQDYIRAAYSKHGNVEKSFFRRIPNNKKISISMYAGGLSF